MAEDKNVVKQIVWGEVFSFPHIFKSFKMAIQPGKLALAVLGLALIFGGGYVLSALWCWTGATVPTQVNGEAPIMAHVGMDSEAYCEQVSDIRDNRLDQAAGLLAGIKNQERSLQWWQSQGGVFATKEFRDRLNDYNNRIKGDDPVNTQDLIKAARDDDDSYADLLSEAEEELDKEFEKVQTLLDEYEGKDELAEVLKEQTEKDIEEASKAGGDNFTEEQADQMWEEYEDSVEAIDRAFTARRLWFAQQKQNIVGTGVFGTFVAYETNCINNAMMSLWNLNFRGGLCAYSNQVRGRWFAPRTTQINTGLGDPNNMQPPNDQPGFLVYVLLAAEGVRWLIVQHWLFAIVFLLWTTCVCAFVGGGIYRMSALHFAREEKISVGQALKFSREKFFSFFCAPLVPIAVIVLTGLVISLGGLLFSLAGGIGAIIMGVIFGLAILLAVGIAFMTIGLLAGWPLMYPTIAVEGSDSFDAISRSFSYIFARPFRALLYGVVAAFYGMITYLFVRLFAYVALLAVHCFVKLGWWDGIWDGGDALHSRAELIDALWHKPTFWDLQTVNWAALDGIDKVAAVLLGAWVALVVGAVLGYVWTYFASATTCIYYILRRRVDATDLDDVYIEEEAEPIAPAEETQDVAEEEKAEGEEDQADESAEEETDEKADEDEDEDDEEEKPE
jgi:hypothetical protein